MKKPQAIDFLVKSGATHTISELMMLLDLNYNQLYVLCRAHGIRPKESTWCTKIVNGEHPLPPDKPKIKRPPAVYDNRSAYNINWDNINAHE